MVKPSFFFMAQGGNGKNVIVPRQNNLRHHAFEYIDMNSSDVSRQGTMSIWLCTYLSLRFGSSGIHCSFLALPPECQHQCKAGAEAPVVSEKKSYGTSLPLLHMHLPSYRSGRIENNNN
jgi:hypothetical protein